MAATPNPAAAGPVGSQGRRGGSRNRVRGRGGRVRNGGSSKFGRGMGNSRGDKGNNDTGSNGNNKAGGASASLSGKLSGGNNSRRRHFSARGDAAVGRGNGGVVASGDSADATLTCSSAAQTPRALSPAKNVLKSNGFEEKLRKMSDQDVLIAFGPYVRSGDPVATRIHKEYLSKSRQREFIKNARKFLVESEERVLKSLEAADSTETESIKPNSDAVSKIDDESGWDDENVSIVVMKEGTSEEDANEKNSIDVIGSARAKEVKSPQKAVSPCAILSPPPGLPAPMHFPNMRAIEHSTAWPLDGHNSTKNQSSSSKNNNDIPLRPPPGMGSLSPGPLPGMESLPFPRNDSVVLPNLSPICPVHPPGMLTPVPPLTTLIEEITVASFPPKNGSVPSTILPARTPPPLAVAPLPKVEEIAAQLTTPAKAAKVRRTQTRCEEQPGRLFANGVPAAAFVPVRPSHDGYCGEASLTARPRSELTARWALPLPYLRNRALRRFEKQKRSSLASTSPQNLTIRDALSNLAVGLFRRGAAESGSQSSIVSKEILARDMGGGGERQPGRPLEDYFFDVDQQADSVFGTVPFYAPRTPGHVVFRLYFEDEPHITLATGPCVRVVPTDADVDPVLRFILSNFKAKKTNGISSMNSLASVFELFSPRQNAKNSINKSANGEQHRHQDGAGRVAWGCLCESRKVVEQAGSTYIKKKRELEERAEVEKIKEGLPDLSFLGVHDAAEAVDLSNDMKEVDGTDNAEKDRAGEVKAQWASEEYSNERKWREMQQVYASILKAAVSNEGNQLLLKRDILAKLRLEYMLWCPLIEAFAPNPFAASTVDNVVSKLPGDVSAYPHSVTSEHSRKCNESRARMQERVLGFVPQCVRPSMMKFRGYKNTRANFFRELSSAMAEIYRDEYAVSEGVWRRREQVRAKIERAVGASGEFPSGTKVAVFGSSANGFGSPKSDLDLCLQVPTSATHFTREIGVQAMINLATKLTEAGMTDVDTIRLTARIPIVKFNVPYKDDGGEILVECDLSLQNPLACLNTSLLHAYSKISPSTCVVASIIKRWAKAREINNPSQHTLSSYGYVIMLIYFLTAHDFTKDGYATTPGEDANNKINPILPNLLWVDPVWAQDPKGPYREVPTRPRNRHLMLQHPTEANYYVNSYFYRTGLESLSRFFSDNHNPRMSLGMLLTSFFHHFAYEFDYKRHVVSLNARHSSPWVEREVKAEEDGWSLYRHSLTIEDPFELFYDVAHVLKASNFQHIRREFSLAYTKIANAACTNNGHPTLGRELIDLICEPVGDECSNA